MTNDHPFTLAHYRVLLKSALAENYRFSLFDEAPRGRAVYLRHDVDNSIDDATTIAELERDLGIRASYLFLLRSRNYNLICGDSIAKVRAIAGMGHAVGLHFTREPGDEPEGQVVALADRISADAGLMANVTGLKIQLFSFHNPAGRSEFQVEVPGLINVYAARYFKEMKYLSESNFRWREGCPCELFRAGRYEVLQLLIHPMSYCDDLKTDRDALLYFLYRKLVELREVNGTQNLSLREHPVDLKDIADYVKARAVMVRQ